MWRALILLISFALTICLAIAVIGDKDLPSLAKPSGTVNSVTAPDAGNARQQQLRDSEAGTSSQPNALESNTGSIAERDTNRDQDTIPQQPVAARSRSAIEGVDASSAATSASQSSTSPWYFPSQSPREVAREAGRMGVPTAQQHAADGVQQIETSPLGSTTSVPERVVAKQTVPQNTAVIALDATPQTKSDVKLAPTRIAPGAPPPADQRRVRVNIPEDARRQ